MEIDIRHIAKLARLHIDEEQLPRFQKEMEGIIQMVNGMKTPAQMDLRPDPANAMVLREDVVQPSFPRDQLLANAPQTEAGCVVVPRTVE
ncbi:MAG TPA: Asp-tRNA(Asn)/Glu-tRNA(Gln) amidotransferase subunit GatC [Firmicutes bacterium]|nr:Asp-tRNA(Asn)/Glu-tRNA(Gln) amidotransferase subunit GatC [Bacillota bacterium]